MATLTAQLIARAGLTPSYAACTAEGDEFVNTGSEFIHIKNGHSATQIVTIATPRTVDGLAVAERTVSILATSEQLIGPFPAGTYNDSAGKVQLTYDAVVSLTIAVLRPGS